MADRLKMDVAGVDTGCSTVTKLIVAITTTALLAAPVAADAKPAKLSYKEARKAARAKADRFAKQPTKLAWVTRIGDRRYAAYAKWQYTVTDPDGCKGCDYDPVTDTFYDTPTTETMYCSVDLVVVKRGRKVTAKVDGHSCF